MNSTLHRFRGAAQIAASYVGVHVGLIPIEHYERTWNILTGDYPLSFKAVIVGADAIHYAMIPFGVLGAIDGLVDVVYGTSHPFLGYVFERKPKNQESTHKLEEKL